MSALSLAIDFRCKDAVELLMQHGVDPNKRAPDAYAYAPDDGTFPVLPMHKAAASGYVEIVELLLDHGADVNIINRKGETPLSWACFKGQKGVVQLLISRQANPNMFERDGRYFPIHFAAANGDAEIVKILLRSYADINAKDIAGRSALTIACARGRQEVVALLLEKGADPDHLDGSGHSPMSRAISQGHFVSAWFLFKHRLQRYWSA